MYGRKMKTAPDSEKRPARVCTPRHAYKKASQGIRLSRWELADLALNPEWSLRYCRDVLKSRWPSCEPVMARSALAVNYATMIVGGRWEECEDHVSQNPGLAVRYANEVLKDRWEQGEPAILRDYNSSWRYMREVLHGGWEPFEEKLAGHIVRRDPDWDSVRYNSRASLVHQYVCMVGRRVPALERALTERPRASCLYAYSRGVGGRLPGELHSRMMLMGFDERGKGSSSKYMGYLGECERRAERWISDLDEGSRREFLKKWMG